MSTVATTDILEPVDQVFRRVTQTGHSDASRGTPEDCAVQMHAGFSTGATLHLIPRFDTRQVSDLFQEKTPPKRWSRRSPAAATSPTNRSASTSRFCRPSKPVPYVEYRDAIVRERHPDCRNPRRQPWAAPTGARGGRGEGHPQGGLCPARRQRLNNSGSTGSVSTVSSAPATPARTPSPGSR
jgi:hypothetical protein